MQRSHLPTVDIKSFWFHLFNFHPVHFSSSNVFSKRIPVWMYRTQCQDEFRSLSGSVTEILTACRMYQISIPWCQNDAEIRGFPTMYIMVGVNMVKIGKKHDFVQHLGLKTPISVDRNFEHLTSEGSVTQNFEVSSFLTPSLQNMDIDGPN